MKEKGGIVERSFRVLRIWYTRKGSTRTNAMGRESEGRGRKESRSSFVAVSLKLTRDIDRSNRSLKRGL